MMSGRKFGALLAALALAACSTSGDDGTGGSGGSGATGGQGGTGGTGQGGEGGTGGTGQGGEGGTGGVGQGGEGGTGGTGHGGEGGHGGNPQIGDQVLGTVIDHHGEPLVGALAVLNHAFDAAQVTDESGGFGFDEVDLPYDLTLKLPSGDLVELRGLTRREPKVALFDNDNGLSRATLSGTITSLEDGFAAGDAIMVSTTNTKLGSFVVAEPGPFSGETSWSGGESVTVSVVAAHITPNTDGSLSFRAAGVLPDVTLEDGASASDLEIELSPSPIATFRTRVEVDFGAYSNERSSSVLSFELHGARFDRSEHFGEDTELSNGAEIDLPKEGGRLFFSGVDAGETLALHVVKVTSAGTTSVSLPGSPGVKLTAPDEGATDVSRLPELSWSAVPGAKGYWLELEGEIPNGSRQYHHFYLPGDTTSLSLADLGSDEVQLAGATTYSWTITVGMTARFIEADEIADGRGMGAVRIFSTDEFLGFRTSTRSFTTAP